MHKNDLRLISKMKNYSILVASTKSVYYIKSASYLKLPFEAFKFLLSKVLKLQFFKTFMKSL